MIVEGKQGFWSNVAWAVGGAAHDVARDADVFAADYYFAPVRQAKATLDQLAIDLAHEPSLLSAVSYAAIKPLADLTPDLRHGTFTDHARLAAQSLADAVGNAGQGIVASLWTGKNDFVLKALETSRVKNPVGAFGLATCYTLNYYVKTFTVDTASGIGSAVFGGTMTTVHSTTTEEALLGGAQVVGGLNAVGGAIAGGIGAGQVLTRIPNAFNSLASRGGTLAMVNTAAPQAAAATIAAVGLPGGTGNVFMAALDDEAARRLARGERKTSLPTPDKFNGEITRRVDGAVTRLDAMIKRVAKEVRKKTEHRGKGYAEALAEQTKLQEVQAALRQVFDDATMGRDVGPALDRLAKTRGYAELKVSDSIIRRLAEDLDPFIERRSLAADLRTRTSGE